MTPITSGTKPQNLSDRKEVISVLQISAWLHGVTDISNPERRTELRKESHKTAALCEFTLPEGEGRYCVTERKGLWVRGSET